MKPKVFLLIGIMPSLFWACGQDTKPDKTPIRIMTYNVMCIFCGDDTHDSWDERVPFLREVITEAAPDILGAQEFFMADDTVRFFSALLDYEVVYYVDDGDGLLPDYADALIAFKKDRFRLVESGFYWLSKTPDEPFTGGWTNAQFPRLVTWAHLRQKSDHRHLFVASTHFDNNTPNQENSAPILLERTAPWTADMPAVVVGDFNSKPSSEAYGLLTDGENPDGFSFRNTFDLAPTWSELSNQDNAPAYDPSQRIDHIFLGDDSWTVGEWVVDTRVFGPNNRHPSDHDAMFVDLVRSDRLGI